METVSRLALTYLFNAFWQVTAVACVAALGAWLMRNAPARFRHLIWVMALALSVLLPFACVRSSWRTGLFPNPVSATADPRGVRNSGDFPRDAQSRLDRTERTSRWPWQSAGSGGVWDYFRPRTNTITLAPYLSLIILALYFFSLAFHSRRLWRAWQKTMASARSGYARELPASMAAAAARCCSTLGLRAIPILASAKAAGPMTLGARRPVIIFPEDFFREASGEEALSVLAHETAHIARRDFLMNLIYELLALPIAFHPGAIWLKRRINETRELACDEIATSRLTGASDYARSLVALARKMSTPPAFPRAGYLLGVFDANILEERIMRILDQKHRLNDRLAKATLAIGVFLLAASCIFASAFSLSISQEKTTQGDDALKPFVGTWNAKLKGKPYVTLTLNIVDHKLAGKLTSYRVILDDNGRPAEVTEEPTVCPVAEAKVESKNLTLRGDCFGGTPREFAIRLTAERELEFQVVGAPPPPEESRDNPHGLKLTKEPEKSSELPAEVKPFLGTWQASFEGKPFMTLKLSSDGDNFLGTMSPCRIVLDANGKLTEAERSDHGTGWHIVGAHFDGTALTLRAKEDGSEDVDQFEMKLTGDTEAEFKPAGTPMPVEPWKMTRDAGKSTSRALASSARRYVTALRRVQTR